jgi:serine protease Do
VANQSRTEPRPRVPGRVPPLTPGTGGKRLEGSGSAFFICASKLLTKFHGVKRCRALTVDNNTDGKEVDAQLFVTDATADLALLDAIPPDIALAQFRVTGPEDPRDEFAMAGYTEHGLPGLEAELDRVMMVPDDIVAHRARYQFYGPNRRGNSGRPLLDRSGAAIGTATAKINMVQVYRHTGQILDDLGFAISSATRFAFLGSHGIEF